MNAERLLQLYDRVSDAPDAIPRLRRFILDLAVRGKLVEQNPEDESATELLSRISRAKALRVQAGQVKSRPDLPDVVNEGEYELPSSWNWVRFGNLADFSAGRTPSRNDTSLWNTGDYAWVSIADMVNGEAVVATKETVSNKARSQVFKCEPEPPGTIIMSFKLTIGKISRLQIPAFHNEAIISIRPHLDELDPFLFRVLPDLARGGETKGAIKGATLNRESISNILVPLPPLAEQHRIVAKIDELMGLCDSLEVEREKREATRDRLTTASLGRLTAPDVDGKQFKAHADFAIRVLPELTTRPDQINGLRQSILDLAVRGKLVEQDPNDEPASVSLKCIEAERQDLIDKKVIRRERELPSVGSEETPFELPHSWLWVRVGEVALFTQYGTSMKAQSTTDGVPVLTMGNIQGGAVCVGGEKQIPKGSVELPALYLKHGDLLYNRTNSAELVGKTGIYLGEDDTRTFASYLIRICLSKRNSLSRYVNLAMNAPFFRSTQIVPLIKQQTGQANVNGTFLKNMLVPLPPLREQYRIVDAVDGLMSLCDRLSERLVSGRDIQSRLLEALLVEALEPIIREAA